MCCAVIEAPFLSLDVGLSVSTHVFVYLHCTLPFAGTYGCSLRGRLLDDKLNPEDPANLHLRIKMLAGSNLKRVLSSACGNEGWDFGFSDVFMGQS